ncbi:MAG: Smr/MutS family protein [Deltaproteobacteria bacterium]|nr:Smr/MutS family protein [Deltaproteobacteria bacterium]
MSADASLIHTAELLEWPKILSRLAEHAMSAPGREACEHLPFCDDADSAARALAAVTEAAALLREALAPALADVTDIAPDLERASLGAMLAGEDLIRVADALRAARRTRDVLVEEWERTPRLAEIAMQLAADEPLEMDIFAAIDRDGEVNDAASPELVELRRRHRRLHQQILDTMNELVKHGEWAEFLQDDYYTVRNGRYVLLVRVERQHKIEGIVHDISGSGQSLYIEPKEITNLNNVLRGTEVAIAQEVARILRALTARVAATADAIHASAEALVEIDIVFAKARYAAAIGASEPTLAPEGRMRLRALRHPLLVGRDDVRAAANVERVVTNDVEFAAGAGCVIVTGPNTGGKTVLLKAVGLAALFVRAGMHPPVAFDSETVFFDRVFAVIGDRQSIEAGLSTFAAHLAALREIARDAGPRSLVLLDEIGEGTDPRQGVALSMAVLEHLVASGARTLATTHFSELAALATQRAGFVNASMEFDPATMRPTYRLRLGIPGRSGAFDVAERMGLPAPILARARELYEGAGTELQAIMEDLDRAHQEWRSKTTAAERDRATARDLVEKQRELLRDLESKKRERAQKELAAVESMYRDARERIRALLAELKERPTRAEAQSVKEQIAQVVEEVRAQTPPPEDAIPERIGYVPIRDWSAMHEGDAVYIGALRAKGKLETLPDARSQLRVLVAGARVTIDAADVFHPVVDEAPAEVRVRVLPPARVEAASSKDRSLDLRGQYVADALDHTAEYLDLAWRSRWHQVTIIHGHGTGSLKREIREYLRGAPYALAFRPGERGEGGDGATVVDFDYSDEA